MVKRQPVALKDIWRGSSRMVSHSIYYIRVKWLKKGLNPVLIQWIRSSSGSSNQPALRFERSQGIIDRLASQASSSESSFTLRPYTPSNEFKPAAGKNPENSAKVPPGMSTVAHPARRHCICRQCGWGGAAECQIGKPRRTMMGVLVKKRQDIPPLRSGNFKSIPGTTAKQSHAISTYTQEENSSRTRARGITLNMPSGAHTAYGSLPAHARRGYCMGRSASSFACQQSSNLRMVPVATLARYEAGISEFASSNSRVWFDGFDFWSTASSGRMDW
ncbi:hypothetical protein FB45DRAFT_1104735 [Roridomyces roridus]|uniref:Uncharacterized protein n=1 Tax=Roridomyces roridus TaxID=1738132 RepID=A0AAD7FDF0_9AGAR|nr:hypothetical protein FB45DRAFT_1104735 [Roridomyces roridus]